MQPVEERVSSVDVVRGVALLGILLMNILSFSMLYQAEDNPTIMGGTDRLNLGVWYVVKVLFEGKMRALFSMLFGAGVILMTGRAETRGENAAIADVWLRRNIWLLLFGAAHGWLLWDGDILFAYGLCGLFLYPFRKLRPAAMLALGGAFLCTIPPKTLIEDQEMRLQKAESEIAAVVEKSKLKMTDELKKSKEGWEERLKEHQPPKAEIEKRVAKYQGGYFAILGNRAGHMVELQSSGLYRYLFWDAMGMMLIGMALMKSGVLSAERSTRFYLLMAVAGYAIGLPIRAAAIWHIAAWKFDILSYAPSYYTYDLTRISLAAGHLGLVMLIVKQGWLQWLTRRLAAVGQMALTNYLSHSLICTTLFYGYGFGLFGKLDRVQVYLVVFAIWTFQLIVSPVWLRYYRFGPVEWVWRSLTYWQRQPMVHQQCQPQSSPAPAEA